MVDMSNLEAYTWGTLVILFIVDVEVEIHAHNKSGCLFVSK